MTPPKTPSAPKPSKRLHKDVYEHAMQNMFHGYCAKGKCLDCGKVLQSMCPGDFVSCPCGNAVDTDRMSHARHRFIGNVANLRSGKCECPIHSPRLWQRN